MLEPAQILRPPIAQDKSHAATDLPGHSLQVGTVTRRHDNLATFLCQRDGESGPSSITFLVVSANREIFCRINGVTSARTVIVLDFIIKDVDGALASVIALVKDAVLIGHITLVRCRSKAKFVRLHDVKLGARGRS